MAKKVNNKKKEKGTCRQLSKLQITNLARLIIGETECTDISQGTARRKKRKLPPPEAAMIF